MKSLGEPRDRGLRSPYRCSDGVRGLGAALRHLAHRASCRMASSQLPPHHATEQPVNAMPRPTKQKAGESSPSGYAMHFDYLAGPVDWNSVSSDLQPVEASKPAVEPRPSPPSKSGRRSPSPRPRPEPQASHLHAMGSSVSQVVQRRLALRHALRPGSLDGNSRWEHRAPPEAGAQHVHRRCQLAGAARRPCHGKGGDPRPLPW